jgi:hypothetical protein
MTWFKHRCFNCGHVSRDVVQIPLDFTNGGEYRCDDVRSCAQRHNEARGLSDTNARKRIDYLEATLLMFVRNTRGKHDIGFPAAIKELAAIARNAHAPSDDPVYHAHTTDKASSAED